MRWKGGRGTDGGGKLDDVLPHGLLAETKTVFVGPGRVDEFVEVTGLREGMEWSRRLVAVRVLNTHGASVALGAHIGETCMCSRRRGAYVNILHEHAEGGVVLARGLEGAGLGLVAVGKLELVFGGGLAALEAEGLAHIVVGREASLVSCGARAVVRLGVDGARMGRGVAPTMPVCLRRQRTSTSVMAVVFLELRGGGMVRRWAV